MQLHVAHLKSTLPALCRCMSVPALAVMEQPLAAAMEPSSMTSTSSPLEQGAGACERRALPPKIMVGVCSVVAWHPVGRGITYTFCCIQCLLWQSTVQGLASRPGLERQPPTHSWSPPIGKD